MFKHAFVLIMKTLSLPGTGRLTQAVTKKVLKVPDEMAQSRPVRLQFHAPVITQTCTQSTPDTCQVHYNLLGPRLTQDPNQSQLLSPDSADADLPHSDCSQLTTKL